MMSRLSGLVVLVATLCLAQSQTLVASVATSVNVIPTASSLVVPNGSSTASKSVGSDTNSKSVAPNTYTPVASNSIPPNSVTPTKSSSMSSTSSVKPTTTPGPNPPGITNYTYILMDENNENLTCLRMVVDVAVNLTYVYYNMSSNITFQKSVWIHFTNDSESVTEIDNTLSKCVGDSEDPHAILVLRYTSTQGVVDPYYVNFTFSAIRTPGNQQWLSQGMSVSFMFNENDFPDYHGEKPKDKTEIFSYTNQSLFDESFQRMELTRPYICRAENNYTKFSSITPDNSLNVSLSVRQLEVQAFNFTNPNNGTFDNNAARVCLLDNKNTGNTIVPIAVGAALALLVIVVIIAYLIGRVRNKKKSSYEPLN